MEPLKKVQVEGYIMMAEPEMLFGNLDELCCVSCPALFSIFGQGKTFQSAAFLPYEFQGKDENRF